MCQPFTVALYVEGLILFSCSAALSQEVQNRLDSDTGNLALERRIAGLEKQVAILTNRVRAAEERVNQNARNRLEPEKRSADLSILRTQLRSGESLTTLHKRLQMGSSTHADYEGPGYEVGGNPVSVMTFFLDSQGSYYRVFDQTRVKPIEKPASWLKDVVDAAMPSP